MNKDVLTVLQEDFNVCKKFIHKVAKTLLNEEVSKYRFLLRYSKIKILT